MNLQNIKVLHKKEGGFTIVELLIVIVIIGILAALVIIAYSGIQNRAKDQKYNTDAQAIVKKAEAFAADDSAGAYPTTSSSTAAATTFGATSVSKLPNGFTVTIVTAAPTYATAASNAGSGTYSAAVCSVNKGLKVYYPKTSDSSLQNAVAGTCP